MGPKCQQVFNTPELLHLVLLQLDAQTLLTSVIRTCWHWNKTVFESAALRQALYLESVVDSGHGQRQLNPLLREVFPTMLARGAEDEFRRYAFKSLPLADASRRHKFVYEKASWRRMLVSQPAIRRLGCAREQAGQRCPPSVAISSSVRVFPDGLRMGDYHDLLIRWFIDGPWLAGETYVIWDREDAESYCDPWSSGIPSHVKAATWQRAAKKKLLDEWIPRNADAMLVRHEGTNCFLGWPGMDQAAAMRRAREQDRVQFAMCSEERREGSGPWEKAACGGWREYSYLEHGWLRDDGDENEDCGEDDEIEHGDDEEYEEEEEEVVNDQEYEEEEEEVVGGDMEEDLEEHVESM